MAQQGYAYTFQGQVRITRMVYRLDDSSLDPACDCLICKRYTRGYLHHLMRGKHHLGSRMLSIHNVRHFQLLMGRLREAILKGSYAQMYRELRAAIAAPRDQGGEVSPDVVTLKDVG
jgi:queuine tRNA-ribosyltransferase